MSAPHSAVAEAIQRWRDRGLIDEALGRQLLAEAADAESVRGRRQGQLVLAGLGAVLLFAAAAVLSTWAWPRLGDVGRSFLLAVLGVAAQVLGAVSLREPRWRPAGYGLVAVGLSLLLAAFIYSQAAWPDGSAPALAVAMLSLLVPLSVLPLGFRRHPPLAAIGTTAFFGFLAVALDRGTALEGDAIVWILDALLAGALLLAAGRRGWRLDRAEPWEAAALLTGLFGGLVLVLITTIGPLDMGRWAPLPVDVWWLGVTLLLLLAVRLERAPLPRRHLERLLSLCILLGIGLIFWTMGETFRPHYVVTSLAVATLGIAGITLALARGILPVLPASALAIVVAAWFLAVEAGGTLPAALALGFTAAVFFWTSGRMGRGRAHGRVEMPEHGRA